ncbi:MAG: T9SS type A sorting domain-containing protein [Bacteroidales bacterium]|nr:T9SS type A sorting domain-containing protein [Bacteroidales bacterium]
MNLKLIILLILSQVLIINVQSQHRTKIIAHRGASSIAPENTISAFSAAIDIGADFIELDIQTSKDDSLIVMHDEFIDRTTSGTGKIADLSYNELIQISAGYSKKFGNDFRNEPIPTLFEVLYLAKDKIKVCIDLKSASEISVIKLIEKIDMLSQVVLLSFNLDKLSRAKSYNKNIQVMLLKNNLFNIDIALAAEINAFGVGGGILSPSTLIDNAHKAGIEFWRGVINNTAKMNQLIQKGVDGIFTDYPQLMKPMLEDNIIAYPNPFNKSVTIKILNSDQKHEVSIFNINGILITKFTDVKNIIEWTPFNMTSGIYIINSQLNDKIISEKVIYSK